MLAIDKNGRRDEADDGVTDVWGNLQTESLLLARSQRTFHSRWRDGRGRRGRKSKQVLLARGIRVCALGDWGEISWISIDERALFCFGIGREGDKGTIAYGAVARRAATELARGGAAAARPRRGHGGSVTPSSARACTGGCDGGLRLVEEGVGRLRRDGGEWMRRLRRFDCVVLPA